MVKENTTLDIERNLGNFAYPETHTHDAGVGLTEKTIHYISDVKQDPDWVREFRLNAYKTFLSKPMPTHWASKDLEAIVFDNIRYYLSSRKILINIFCHKSNYLEIENIVSFRTNPSPKDHLRTKEGRTPKCESLSLCR